jgi:hypothetical protein
MIGLIIALGAKASAATITSTTTGGNWATGATWVGGVAPGAADNAIIAGPVAVAATINQTGSVEVQSGGTLTCTTAVTTVTLGSLTIDAGGTVTCSRVLTVNGATVITGTINFQTTARADAFNGGVTLNSGAVWNETVAITPTISGSWTNNATTFTASTGVHTFSGTAMTFSGTTSIPSVTVTGSYTNNGTLSATTALAGAGTLTNSATGTLNIGGTCSITTLANQGTIGVTGAGAISTALANFTNTGTINLNGSGNIAGITNNAGGLVNLTNSGTIASFNNATSTSTLNISDNTPTFTALTATATGNTVIYSGVSQTIVSTNYYNLTLSGSGTDVLQTGTTAISGNLTLSGTVATTAVVGLTIGGNVNLGSGTSFNSASYTLNVAGNWINNGCTLTPGTSTTTFNGTGAQTVGGTAASTFYSISATGTGGVTTAQAVTINGNLSIGNGEVFTIANYAFAVTGTTTVGGGASGILSTTATTAALQFTGLLTISAGGTWSNSGNDGVAFQGGITNNGAFASGTGTCTFNTNSQAIGGTAGITFSGSLAITGAITVTNNTNVTVMGNLTGSVAGSTWLNAANSTLNVGAAVLTTGTLTATATGNTVNYAGTGQTVKVVTYYNLTLSGGPETFGAITTISGNLTLSGPATATTAAALAITGNLVVGSGTSFASGTTNTWTLSVTGTTSVTGTLTLANTGAKTFTGAVTINGGGSVIETAAGALAFGSDVTINGTLTESGAATVTVAGNFTNNWIYTASTGTHTFSGAAKTIDGTSGNSISNVAVTGTYTNNGTLTVSTSLSGAGGLTNGATGSLNIGGTCSITTLANQGTMTVSGGGAISTALANFTNSGTLGLAGTGTITGVTNSGTTNLSSSGTITAFTNTGTLNISANTVPTITTLTAAAAGNTVNYSGASQTIISTNYYNLTLGGSGTDVLQTGTTTIGGNLTLGGTVTTTTVVGLTISGNLVVGDGTTFTVGNYTFTVTGTTTVGGGTSGTLSITATTAALQFTGLVTINAGGTWNNSGNDGVTFRGGITNIGTFTAGTGVQTFNTNAQALTGTFAIPNVTVTTVTLTNNNTLTVGTALSGTGGLTQAANATLNIGGTSGITTLTATNTGNTVNYTGAGQTLKVVTYYNLTLSGGPETFGAIATVNGNLTLSGSATATLGANLAIGVNLIIGDGTTLTVPAYTIDVTGTTTVGGGTSGTLSITSTTGTKTFTGAVTINSGANFTETVAEAITFGSDVTINGTLTENGAATIGIAGNFTDNGTYTASTGVHTFSGATKTIGGTSTNSIPTATFTGAYTNTGTLTVATLLTVTGVTLTNNGAITASTALSGTGGVAQGTTGFLYIGGTSGIATLTATATGNTVNYNGAAQTVHSNNYYNLTLSGSGTDVLQAGTTTVGDSLVLSGTVTVTTVVGLTIGNLVIGDGTTFTSAGYNLTVNGTTTVGGGASGTLSITSTTGTKTFTGAVTINSGANFTETVAEALTFGSDVMIIGTLTENGAATVTFGGNFTDNGTYTPSTGVHTFSGTGKTIGGTSTISIPSVTVSGSYTNNGTLNVTTALAGTGTLTQGTNATLNINFTGSAGISTLNATGVGNTVNYGYAGTQTVLGINYYNLTLSGTSAKTLQTGTTTISGSLTLSGTATTAGVANLTIGGNVNIGTGTTLTAGTYTYNVAGNWTTSGTFTYGTSTVNYNGNYIGQIVGGGMTYYNLQISNGGTKVLQGGNATVSNVLTLNSGIFQLGSNNLLVTSASASAITGTYGSTSMIETNSTGYLQKSGATNGGGIGIVYPIGSGGFYNPLDLSSGFTVTSAVTGTLQISATAANQGSNALSKYWTLTVTGYSGISTSLKFTYDPSEVHGSQSTYDVWYNAGSSWVSAPGTHTALGADPFGSTVSSVAASAITGKWSAGSSVPGSVTVINFYSYQSGDWNDATTWTTDASGSLWHFAGTPGGHSSVTILNGRTITVSNNSQTDSALALLSGGVLDIGSTTGDNFGTVTGQGNLRLSSNTFPGGTYTSFVAANGGTIEYYNLNNVSFASTQLTYNNLIISNYTSGTNSTFINNTASPTLVVNGSFSLQNNSTGTETFYFGNPTTASDNLINMTVYGNFTVGSGCNVRVSNFASSHAIPNPTNNTTSYPVHTLNLYGNLTNNGSIRFTGLPSPANVAYYTLTGTAYNNVDYGEVQVFFYGAANNTIACNGTTDFFRLIEAKGSDNTYTLEVSSSSANDFALYAPNNQGNDDFNGGPEGFGYGVYYKALFIHYGALKLDTNINVPSLTEGGQDFNIIPTAELWVNGASVQTNTGVNGTGWQAATLYGTLRVSGGKFSTGTGAGVVLGTLGTPTIRVDGTGLLDVSNAWEDNGATNLMSYIQTGGTANFRLNGEAHTGPMFGLNNPNSSFTMSGGTINFTNNTFIGGTTEYEILDIEPQSGYYQVTGGTININVPGSTTPYTAISTVPLYNMNISQGSGTGGVTVQWTAPTPNLNLLGNLTINSNAVLDLNTNPLSLFVGGNFTIASGGTYIPGTTDTTAFDGTSFQAFTNAGTIGGAGINAFSITNSSNTATISNNVTVNGPLTIGQNAVLNDSGRVITVLGNISISGVDATTQTTGGITLSGTNAQTISGGGSGVFNNLTLNKTAGTVTVTANIAVTGNLRLAGATTGAWNILSIGSQKLSLGANAMVYSDGGTGTAFSSNKMIQTSGSASDGGVSKTYSNTTAFLFPFGFGSYYLPALIQYGSTPGTFGTVTTRPVNSRHPLDQGSNDALTCYWKTTSSGFSGVPSGSVNLLYYYNEAFVQGTEAQYEAAYYNSTSWVISGFTINTTVDSISFRALNYSDGEFTAGMPAAFGTILTLYSITSGDWNSTATWSLQPHGSAYSDYPHATTVAYIDSGTNVTTTHADSSANLTIQPTAMLEIQTNAASNSFGTIVNNSSTGSGTLRIDTSGYFPKGDWGSFLGSNGGTVEYYQKSTATLNLPTTYTLPSGGTANITNYCNLIISPYSGGNINLPNTNLTIYKNFTAGYSSAGGTTNCVTRIDTANTTMTLEVKGTITVNQYGILQYQNGAAQNVIADSDLIISAGGTLRVRNGGSSVANTLTVMGNVINNDTLDLDSNYPTNDSYNCTLIFSGSSSKALTNTVTPARTRLYSITVNKGTILDSIVTVSINPAGFQMGGGGLSLQNGTFRLTSAVTMAISSGAFTIPVTGGLSANGGTFNIVTGTTSADLTLKGRLEVLAGSINVGPNMTTGSSSILYSAAGSPTIKVSGGSLNVFSQIRRDTLNNSGSLNYTQTGGTVTIQGKNPAIPTSIQGYRGAFEVLNDGSSFAMGGGQLIVANGNINSITPYDVDIEPGTSSVTGGTIQLGYPGVTTNAKFRFQTSVPLWSLTLDATTNDTAIQEVYDATLLGNLTIGGTTGYYDANGLDLEIGGNLVNNNTDNSTGLKTGGFRADTVTQTTSFLGTANQTITGTSSNRTNFANLEIATASADTAFLTSGKGKIVVNGNLTLTSGTLNDGGDSVYVMTNVNNNAIHVSPNSTAGGMIFAGTSNQGMTGSGSGVFGNIEINNGGHGVNMTDNSTINGQIKFTNGFLYIDDYALTLGTGVTIVGTPNASNLILLNGVTSDRGVAKIFPNGASSFAFPIGANGKYTPASFVFKSNSNSNATINVIPVDALHPTVPDTTKDYLNYYWIVSTSGFAKAYSDSVTFTYIPSDTVGTPSHIERYNDSTSTWSTVTGTIQSPTFWFTSTTFIDGCYTIGDAFPSLPILYSITSGNWFSTSLWATDSVGHNAYNKIPNGNPVVINPGDSVALNQNSANAASVVIYGVLDAENTTFHSIGQVSGIGKIRISSTSSGYFAFPGGTYDAFFANPASTVEFYGKTSGRLPLDPGNTTKPYQNVIFSDTSTKYISSVDTKVLGKLIIRKGSILDNTQYNKNIYVLGNWIDSNTVAAGFNPGTGTVYFSDSTVTQRILLGMSSMTEPFYNFAIDNPTGVTIGTGNVSVSNQLILMSGNITTSSSNSLTITDTAVSSVVGGGVNSFVYGPLKKQINNGSSFQFPVGDSASSGRSRFGYVTVSNTSTSGTQTWTAQFFDKCANAIQDSVSKTTSPLRSVNNTEYWMISGPAGGTANVTLSWDKYTGMSSSSSTRALSVVAEWGTSSWGSVGGVVADFGQDSGAVATSSPQSFSSNQVFTIGASAIVAALITSIHAGLWNNPSVWDVGRLPLAFDTVVIAGPYAVTLDTVSTVSRFAVNTGGTYNDSTFALTVTGNVGLNGTWVGSGTLNMTGSGSTLYGTGAATGKSTLNIAGGTTVVASSANLTLQYVSILSGDTLSNYGSVTIDSLIGASKTASVFNDLPGSTLEINGPLLASPTTATVYIVVDSGANYINLSSIAPTLQVQTRITGKDGWRMLAAPDTVTVGSMFGGKFVTQGFTGSTYPSLQPNLLWWNETSVGTSLQAWRQPSSTSDTLKLGRGYMFYVFNGDTITGQSGLGNYSDTLPLTMSAIGAEHPLTTPFDFGVTATTRSGGGGSDTTYLDTASADYGWNLVGNPTPSSINWNSSSGWTKTNVDSTIYVWDPNDTTGGYKVWNGHYGNLGSGIIAPSQAFWVHANNANPSLKCSNGVKSSGGIFLENIAKAPTGDGFLKKVANESPGGSFPKKMADDSISSTPGLSLNLSANGLRAQAYLMFSAQGKLGYDPYDAFSLVPLSNNYLILYTVAGDGQPPMQIQDLPDTGLGDPFSLPLYLGGTVGGQPLNASFTLSWKLTGKLPSGWDIEIMDDAAEKAYSMVTAGELTFQYNTPANLVPSSSSFLEKKSGTSSNQRSITALPWPVVQAVPSSKSTKTASVAPRLRLVISTDGNLNGYLPSTPELAQNYPNPFNPTTNIQFSVPVRSKVTIEIFNVLGQRITTLADQEFSAGTHVVVWNPRAAASGVYFCRLISGSHKKIIKMVLLR